MTLAVEAAGLRLRYGDVTALADLSFTLPGAGSAGYWGATAPARPACCRCWPGSARPRRALHRLAPAGGLGRDYADALVERFRIPRGTKVGQLSLGQRSALGMIFGLAARVPVTLLDECHLGMDAPSRAAFSDELLAGFMAHPRTIVISTHLIDELSPLFEEVLIIDQGRPRRWTGSWPGAPCCASGSSAGPSRPWSTAGSTSGTAGRPRDAGLDLGPVALQDLFVHLTQPTGGAR